MKKMKVRIVLFLFLGVMLCVMGFVFGKMSDSYKGASVQTGRMVDGKFVSDSSNSNMTIGGNSEGVKKFKNYSLIAYGIGAAFFIGGAADWVVYVIKKKQPVKRKNGKVIEKRGNMITVEFQDGSRKRMMAEPDVIIAQGDAGEFIYQAERITGFNAR